MKSASVQLANYLERGPTDEDDAPAPVCFNQKPGPEVIKLFMLNSTEHKIYHANKC